MKFKIYILLLLTTISLLLFFLFQNNTNIKEKNLSQLPNNNISGKTNNLKSNSLSLNSNNWNLSIPSINLHNIPIKNGIDQSTLNEYIGHFPTTQIYDGNIGLAAHNRGYSNNYFENIDNLNTNDEIIYEINNYKRIYLVYNKKVIDSFDWSYLDNTSINTITLITCVKDMPNKRLVIQGYSKGGNYE